MVLCRSSTPSPPPLSHKKALWERGECAYFDLCNNTKKHCGRGESVHILIYATTPFEKGRLGGIDFK
jgi:hypothetical protein